MRSERRGKPSRIRLRKSYQGSAQSNAPVRRVRQKVKGSRHGSKFDPVVQGRKPDDSHVEPGRELPSPKARGLCQVGGGGKDACAPHHDAAVAPGVSVAPAGRVDQEIVSDLRDRAGARRRNGPPLLGEEPGQGLAVQTTSSDTAMNPILPWPRRVAKDALESGQALQWTTTSRASSRRAAWLGPTR